MAKNRCSAFIEVNCSLVSQIMKLFIRIIGLFVLLTMSTTRLFSQCDNSSITINILTDIYSDETSWELTNDVGAIVASDQYNWNEDNDYFSYPLCLEDGCYTFTIYDTFGDGLCSSCWGWDSSDDGYYQLIVEGEMIATATANQFLYVESTYFCSYSAGCLETSACNYNSLASTNDISLCDFPEFGYDCDGNCIVDTDGDSVCDMFEIDGCTEIYACDYDAEATENDGTCTYAQLNVDCEGNSLLPYLNNPPEDVSVSCSEIPNNSVQYASYSSFAAQFELDHNPDGSCYLFSTVSVVLDETIIQGNCPGNYDIIRHWVATDCMDRQVEHTQTITVSDNTPPNFTYGTEPVTITCPIQPEFVIPFATDVCSSPVTYIFEEESVLEGLCDGEYTLYRLVTATDACGNSSTVEQVIEVEDNMPPIWSELLPEQVISSSITTEDFGMPVAEDLCSNVLINLITDLEPGVCPLAVQLTRTFIAIDACGNASPPFVQNVYEDTDLLTFVESTTDALCSYSNDGSVNILTSGAVPPYDIYFGSNNPNNLYPGDYTVTISDDNLCTTTLDFTIFSPPGLQLSLESTEPNCTDPLSGTITVFSAGGLGELNYIWDGVDPLAVSGGDYTIGVEDENGCVLYSDIFVPFADIPVQGELEGASNVMAGDSTVYEYTFTSGSTYEWTFSGAESLVVSDIFAISLLWASEGEGFVCVQETNAFGCIGEQVCIEVNVSVDANEINTLDQILGYPNPTSGKFYCDIPHNLLTGTASWNLIDLSGSIILQGNIDASANDTQTFDFSALASGSYILQIGTSAISVQVD